ncbi:hypothetical protein JAO78_001900 [Alishewanella sp. 16-MA]|uniref:Uncharacterized protein n=1 Tax=Alishewanella maricola TaxID=2795740 RepID=A0ABS8BZT1_9ALTE|nr:hypothetical protein [Alishewanella maricola]MCB5225571.1 hypothetical protein [Alishewanella maricola]
MKRVIKILLVILLCFTSIFAVSFYVQQSNRDCLNIPESEAVDMISRVFIAKQHQASSDGFMFEHKLVNLRYSHELSREIDSDSSLGFIELQYNNEANKKALVAVIYSNCELQWINGT